MRIPTVEELVADMVADQRANMDPLIVTDAEEVVGQMNGIIASDLREGYEVALVAYNAFDPDNVDDSRVTALCAITGTKPQGATKSRFTGTRKLEVDLDATSDLPIGTIFEVDGNPNIRVKTTGTLWSDLSTDTGSTTSTTAGTYYVNAEAETAGRTPINASTLTVITTPVVGLNSVNNPTDAIVGRNVDTPEELLTRREDELAELGSCNVDAIRAALLAFEDDTGNRPILECEVIENDLDTVNPDAMLLPPHSIECIIFDGVGQDALDKDVAQVIWDNKGAGTRTFGTTAATAVTQSGEDKTVRFTRPTLIGVDVEVMINRNATTYAGDQVVMNAWKAYVDGIPSGASTEVRWSVAVKALLAVQGVEGVETIRFRRHGSSYQAAMTDLTLGAREKSTADATASYVVINYA
jgi:uncharacterized phage protein gp47/JayE